MSKQQKVLPRVVEMVARENPGAAILLHGSVQHGYERPGSDIDLFVITEEGEGLRFDLDTVIDGVRVQKIFWPSGPLAEAMRDEPFVFYPFSYARVLRDPHGMATRHQASGRQYFEAHPAIVDLWERQLADVRRVREEGTYEDGKFRMSPESNPEHQWIGEFLDWLRAAVKDLKGSDQSSRRPDAEGRSAHA